MKSLARMCFLSFGVLAVGASVGSADIRLPKNGMSVPPALTDVQSRMLEGPASPGSTSEIIKKYKISRLWPMNSEQDLIEDIVLGRRIINKSIYVSPLTCGGESFARFRGRGVIKSDETFLIDQLLSEIKPSSLENSLYRVNKVWKKAAELYPNVLPKYRGRDEGTDSDRRNSSLLAENRENIQLTSSLIEIKKDSSGNSFVNGSDYTIGGWFKPDWQEAGVPNKNGRMRLFTKKFMGDNGNSNVDEWTIFAAGNVIYFHNFRDGNDRVSSRYLTQDQADAFRLRNASQYSAFDYYDDVVARQNTSLVGKGDFARYVVPPIVPGEKGEVTKPVPVPPGPPPVVPQPPGPPAVVPFPPYPSADIVFGGIGQTGKEYTAAFDLKKFWWATTLGTCYGCVQADTHHDVWHYMAISVHLNDPLGPYVDFWILQDPSPRMFGNRPSFAKNLAHSRWELPRQMASFPVLNPIQYSSRVERECAELRGSNDGGTCVRSILEIGSNNPNEGYAGLMRGIYLSKKALRESEILDLAKQYYPKDTVGCTYKSSPAFLLEK